MQWIKDDKINREGTYVNVEMIKISVYQSHAYN